MCRSVRRHQPLQLFEPVLHEDLAAAGALVGCDFLQEQKAVAIDFVGAPWPRAADADTCLWLDAAPGKGDT